MGTLGMSSAAQHHADELFIADTIIAVFVPCHQHLYFLYHILTQSDKNMPDLSTHDSGISFLVKHPKAFDILLTDALVLALGVCGMCRKCSKSNTFTFISSLLGSPGL